MRLSRPVRQPRSPSRGDAALMQIRRGRELLVGASTNGPSERSGDGDLVEFGSFS